jgi:hypothetical protein
MVFNATFNNISGISWQSVLLAEEIRKLKEPEKITDLSQVTDKLYHIMGDIVENGVKYHNPNPIILQATL